jgi:hypothetical protein
MAGLFPFQAAAGRALKPFGRTPVGFNFRHNLSSYSGFSCSEKSEKFPGVEGIIPMFPSRNI